MIVLKTVDAHIGGSPLRLVTEGFPSAQGATAVARLSWADEHAHHLRQLVMCEPRGHAAMRGAVLMESTDDNAHAGVLFMDADGFYAC